MPNYTILVGDNKSSKELKTPFTGKLSDLRLELSALSPPLIGAGQSFTKDGKPIPLADEAKTTVTSLTGAADEDSIAIILLGETVASSGASQVVLVRAGVESAPIDLPARIGDKAAELRKALQDRKQLTAGELFLDPSGQPVPLRDESEKVWKNLVKAEGGKQRIGVQAAEKQVDATTLKPGDDPAVTVTSPAGTTPGGTPLIRRTQLGIDTEAMNFGTARIFPDRPFWNLKDSERISWLTRNQIFSAMVIDDESVSLTNAPSIKLPPDAPISFYNPRSTLTYRSTQTYNALEHAETTLCENKASLKIGGGFSAFSGSLSGSYGWSNRHDSHTVNEKLYASTSVIIRMLITSLPLPYICLADRALQDLEKLATKLSGDHLKAVDESREIFGWFRMYGQYVATSVCFGAKLTYTDITTISDQEDSDKKADEIKTKAEASFGKFFEAAASFDRTTSKAETTITTSNNRTISMERIGGTPTIGSPADFNSSLSDIDNSRWVFGMDVVPIIAFFPSILCNKVMNTLRLAHQKNPDLMGSQPGNLPALIAWHADRALDE